MGFIWLLYAHYGAAPGETTQGIGGGLGGLRETVNGVDSLGNGRPRLFRSAIAQGTFEGRPRPLALPYLGSFVLKKAFSLMRFFSSRAKAGAS